MKRRSVITDHYAERPGTHSLLTPNFSACSNTQTSGNAKPTVRWDAFLVATAVELTMFIVGWMVRAVLA
jgi:hypothetical protein